LLHDLDSILVERCPDLLVVLDSEHKVVLSSPGLRAAVALVEPGMEFANSLDDPSRERFAHAMGLERDATQAFSLELTHRGRDRDDHRYLRPMQFRERAAAQTIGVSGTWQYRTQ